MKNLKKSDINIQILDKIDSCDESDEIKKFIKDALEFEYEHVDERKVDFRKDYEKLINEIEG